MIRVAFTDNLQRHVTSPTVQVPGDTVGECLETVFLQNEAVRHYVLDEHGSLRRHMNIFVDGQPIKDRKSLADPVQDGAEIFVMQALSGG